MFRRLRSPAPKIHESRGPDSRMQLPYQPRVLRARGRSQHPYRSDLGLDAAESALVERFLPAVHGARPRLRQRPRGSAGPARLSGRGPRHRPLDDEERARPPQRRASTRASRRRRRQAPVRRERARRSGLRLQRPRPSHARGQGRLHCSRSQRVLKPGGVALLSVRTPFALNRLLPRMLGHVVLPRKGLRPDEDRDDDWYVQRPPLGWIVSRCREARLDPVCVCSYRQAIRPAPSAAHEAAGRAVLRRRDGGGIAAGGLPPA